MVGHIFSPAQKRRIASLLLLGLVGTGTVNAQQTYYGAPYTVQSAVLVGSYQTLGEAVSALEAAWAPHCPGCVITAAYFNPATTGDIAASVILNPSSSNPTRDGIFATERIDDPKKVAGVCLICSAGEGQKMAGLSPTASSGDSAQDSTHGAADGLFGGEPVQFGTGNKLEQETDFRGGPWLTFRRFYNAHTPVPGAEMGALWRHTFDRTIEILKSTPGASTGSIDQLVLDRPDGSSETFTHGANGWTTSSDDPDTVTEQFDGSGNTIGYSVFMVGTRRTEQYSAAGQLQSITDLSGAVTTLAYSDATTPVSVAPKPGLLLTVTAPDGRTLSFVYDANARVQTITLPDGGTLGYAYDTNNNLTSVTYPDTHTKQYIYNESTLVDVSLPNAMTGVVDEKGTRFETTSYNDSGQAISTQFALGADKTTFDIFNFSENGVIPVEVTTALGFTYEPSLVNFQGGFKAAGSSANCGKACGQPWKSITYDTNGWPASFTDYNGNKTLTTNNAVGLETQRIDASGSLVQRTTNTTWDSVLRNPLTRKVSDANNNVLSQEGWAYNARGQVVASCKMDPAIPAAASYACSSTGTVPTGVRRMVMTYCNAVDTTQCPIIGLMLTKKGPRTDVDDTTTYTYFMDDNVLHHHGDLSMVTDALGHHTTYIAYDGAGRLTTVADQDGTLSSMTYTPRGWLASQTVGQAAESTTSYTYTPFGAVETMTDPDGVVITYGYDDAHRLTKITDGQGNYIQYTLDAVGNRTAENVYAIGSTTPVRNLSRQFNTLGQLVKTIDGLNHTILDATASGSYDTNGTLVQSKDALGIQRKDVLDALNRLTSTIKNYNGTDVATKNTTLGYDYDALDRVTQVTDPSRLATNYAFDGLSNPTALQSPDTGSSSDTFDAAGNRLTHTDAKGVVSTRTYDALNRVLTLSFADPTLNVVYHYDEFNNVTGCTSGVSIPLGHLSRVVENAVTTIYCYDDRGNVVQKRQVQGSNTDLTTYAYTFADRLSRVTYPSGAVVNYARNTLGQITSVSVTPSGGSTQTVVSNVTYLPFGPVSSYTLGNGQSVVRNYDANYQLVDLASPNFSLHFSRDAMGNITGLGNAPGVPTPIETYTYDPLYRLTGVNDSSGAAIEAYTYNQTGDRLSKNSTGGLATGTYGYQSGTHWLTSIGSAARSYDLNGNTTGDSTSGQTFGFGYDGRNRLTVAQANNVTVGTYTYSALGQRVAKVSTSPQAISERFVYDEASQLLGEYGTSNRDYVWLDNLPIAAVDSSGTTTSVNFVVADELGTPRSISNASGTQIWQWAYQANPFGEKQPTSLNGYTFNLRYPGQYFDVERSVTYNISRDYDSSIGRYLQSDPYGLAAGVSTYAYVSSNPLFGVDKLGLCDEEDEYARCRQAKEDALDYCSKSLPGGRMNQGFEFSECVRDFMRVAECQPNGLPLPERLPQNFVIPPPDKQTVKRTAETAITAIILGAIAYLLSPAS